MESAAIQQPESGPEEGLSPFRYGVKFVKGLVKDHKFWSRFAAIPNGLNLLAQAVVGGLFLASAPLALQVFGFVGCGALAAVGLYAIGYGFPGAWQRAEYLCTRTFPHFNPLKKIGTPFRRRLKRNARQSPPLQEKRKGFFGHLTPRLKTERQQDVFLASITIEGAAATVAAVSVLIAPTVVALPLLTATGGLALVAATWCTGRNIFDAVCATKTLFQTYRECKHEKKMKKRLAGAAASPVPPPMNEKAKQMPAATDTFNSQAVPRKQIDLPFEELPQPKRDSGWKPSQ